MASIIVIILRLESDDVSPTSSSEASRVEVDSLRSKSSADNDSDHPNAFSDDNIPDKDVLEKQEHPSGKHRTAEMKQEKKKEKVKETERQDDVGNEASPLPHMERYV